MQRNKRIKIDALIKDEIEILRKLRNNPETNTFLTYNIPISDIEQEEWFKKISFDQSKMYLSIHNDKNIFIGIVRCDEWDKINRSIRVGIDIIPEFRNQGYAADTYDLLLDYLFNQLGIYRVWLLVLEFNTAAIHLYKKVGFIEEGKQRKAIFRNNVFNDYIMMSMLKDEYESKKSK